MARAVIRTLDSTRRLVLTETTLVGRHWSCAGVVDLPRVPLYWLEFRWSGTGWIWRCLGRNEDTRGPGSVLPDGWRRWPEVGRNVEIRLADSVSVRIVDPSPPEPILESLRSGERIELDEILEHFVLTADGLKHAGPGGVGTGPVLKDGEMIGLSDGPYRLWHPQGWAPTLVDGVDLSAPDCTLVVRPAEQLALFTQGCAEAQVQGACVIYLAAYALARRDDARGLDSGYRENPEIHAAAMDLGGNPDSPTDRVNWERARVRSGLVRAGARGTDQLFERKRLGARWHIRLRLGPEAIEIAR